MNQSRKITRFLIADTVGGHSLKFFVKIKKIKAQIIKEVIKSKFESRKKKNNLLNFQLRLLDFEL